MSDRATPAPHVLSVLDGEDIVLLDLLRGSYYSLNPVASRLWTLLSEGATIGAAIEALCNEFDAPVDAISADVGDVIDRLRRAELVTDI
jgi:hypothetical protein